MCLSFQHSMNKDNPGKKRFKGWPKPSRSTPHLPEERPTDLISPAFEQWISQTIPRSPNPERTGTRSRAQDIEPVQSTEDPSLIASTPELNTEQSSNPGVAKAEQPDQKFVNERITDATNIFAGVGNVSAIAQNTSSAANNLQSVSDTVDTFSVLLGPLKVFNSFANGIVDVHPYAKVSLSIFTCASKMILDQADRDDAVSRLLSKISEVYTFITEEEELSQTQIHPCEAVALECKQDLTLVLGWIVLLNCR
ncbi:hypothetical protein DEU56DRAFT_976940 [Suillus clintonianus]|uniref:uncharacterized protein n=1 Tax=Suillus clintonianus TaxID=1904413 RepID=UPI001B86C7B5|nr:uncharacterized protein DEU56DRAFT_976940 [Suillus clintonianus]KAG2153232.1 hypothetical protein DEU56DRAFT_976940 [Suillus clintonianus]